MPGFGNNKQFRQRRARPNCASNDYIDINLICELSATNEQRDGAKCIKSFLFTIQKTLRDIDNYRSN